MLPGWPLKAVLCFYPVWWVLGIGQYSFILFSIPMLWQLRAWRPLRLLPGIGVWVAFLAWVVFSLVMMPLSAPDTVAGSIFGRTFATSIRLVEYASITVIALYTLNLPKREVSQERIMRWLSVLFFVTVAGGFLGLAAPHFQFSSPLERVLPHGISSNAFVHAFVHPQSAQVQKVLGYDAPRPAAPWGFTNFWGNNISILLIWFCALMWRGASVNRRVVMAVVLAVSLVPIVYSLNRGLWLGLIVSLGYLIWSLAARGDMRGVVASLIILPVIAVAFIASPLHTIVSARQSHGESNDIRAFLDSAAIKGAMESPILGWGGPRKTRGSGQSIAIGPSAKCPNCGGGGIGSTGEFFQVIFSQGFVGIALYFSFFLGSVWRLRRRRSAEATAARLIALLAIFYSFFYNSMPVASGLTLLSLALAWRQILDDVPLDDEGVDAAAPHQLASIRPRFAAANL